VAAPAATPILPAAPSRSAAGLQPTYTPRSPAATGQPDPGPAVPTATAVPPCPEPGRVLAGSYSSALTGQAQAYRIYRPPCYGRSGLVYPTLYLFHGNIHTAAKWDELGIDEAAEAAISAGQIPPLLIVMPDGGRLANESSGGPYSFEGLVVDELIPHIEQNYCAWPEARGRAVGGLSRGGYWALEIAFRHPALFASVGGHSAALLDTHAGRELNPQFTGLANELGDLRVYLDIGQDDYLRTNVQRLHEEMEAAGLAHTWLLNPGRHEDAYWAEQLAAYLLWYAEGWPAGSPPACQFDPAGP
jgi:enterochelin esterase-like enzyme